jgi:hypothetical protein
MKRVGSTFEESVVASLTFLVLGFLKWLRGCGGYRL